MKKLILIGLVAMSCAMARDCRYEEQELNSLIWQYEDLIDDYNIAEESRERRQLVESINPYKDYDYGEALTRNLNETNELGARYNVRFNRLKQRIEEQIQRLNNCRRKK